MTRARPSVPLAEVAELVSAAFDAALADTPAGVSCSARLFRAALLRQLRARYGDDWVRAWDSVAARQASPPARAG